MSSIKALKVMAQAKKAKGTMEYKWLGLACMLTGGNVKKVKKKFAHIETEEELDAVLVEVDRQLKGGSS